MTQRLASKLKIDVSLHVAKVMDLHMQCEIQNHVTTSAERLSGGASSVRFRGVIYSLFYSMSTVTHQGSPSLQLLSPPMSLHVGRAPL